VAVVVPLRIVFTPSHSMVVVIKSTRIVRLVFHRLKLRFAHGVDSTRKQIQTGYVYDGESSVLIKDALAGSYTIRIQTPFQLGTLSYPSKFNMNWATSSQRVTRVHRMVPPRTPLGRPAG
jgi:hypothetical protein